MFISKTSKVGLYNLGVVAMLISSLMSSSLVSAGVPDGLHYMVSPVSCHPEGSTDEARLRYVNGAWTFKDSAQNGSAYLVCPLSFYGNVGEFDNFQLWYSARANNPYSVVRATLMSRNRNLPGATAIATVSTEDATTSGYGFVNKFDINRGTETGENYYVRVLLFRNTNQQSGNVAFTGLAIDLD